MNHSSKTPLFLYRALYVDPLSQTDLLEKLRPFRGTYLREPTVPLIPLPFRGTYLRDQGRGHRNGWASPGPQERLRPTVPLIPLPLKEPIRTHLKEHIIPVAPVAPVVHRLGHASGSLLRCIYTAVHGEPTSFESYTINQEMNERQKMALYFRDRTKELKDRSHRLTNMDVEELLSDLMTMTTRKNIYNSCFGEIFVPLSQTVVYSRFYQRIIHIVCEDIHTYTTFEPVGEPTGPPIYILFHRNQNSFEWKEGWGGSDFVSFLKMENFRMALKPLSQYKMEDLNHIINLLGLGGGGERMKKKDLYTLIQNHVLCLV